MAQLLMLLQIGRRMRRRHGDHHGNFEVVRSMTLDHRMVLLEKPLASLLFIVHLIAVCITAFNIVDILSFILTLCFFLSTSCLQK